MSRVEQQQIIDFIVQTICDENGLDTFPYDAQLDFVASGMLDSFAVLNLILGLELEFGVKFSPVELANKEMRVIEKLAQATLQKSLRH